MRAAGLQRLAVAVERKVGDDDLDARRAQDEVLGEAGQVGKLPDVGKQQIERSPRRRGIEFRAAGEPALDQLQGAAAGRSRAARRHGPRDRDANVKAE
jgi:hypothetical protein